MQVFGFYNDTAPPLQADWNPFGFITTGGFPPSVLEQFKLNNTFTGTISYDSPLEQGNLLVLVLMGTGGTLSPIITDNLGNTWTLFKYENVETTTSVIYGYYSYNCIGGICNIVVTNGPTLNRICFIAEYDGIENLSDPLIAGYGNSGGNSPLFNTLVFNFDSLIFSAWFNPLVNDKQSLVGGLSYISNDVAGESKFNSQQHITKAEKYLSPLNVGVTTNTSPIDVLVTAVFKLGKK